MAGKGRASVNDMKRVEVLVLMEIAQQSESGGTYGFSRKTLAEHVGVSPYRARAAIERLDSDGLIEVVSRYSEDGGQLANGICLTERGGWYLKGIRAGPGRRFVSRWRNASTLVKNGELLLSRVLQ